MERTDAQKAASRANGRKSRGPSTQAGKRRSSRNAARRPNPGLAASAVLEGEDPRLFQRLLAGLQEQFQLDSVAADALIETMAMAQWRLMRLWAMQKEGLEQEMRALDPDAPEITPVARAAQAFRSLSDQSRSLDLMIRCETRYERQFNRALTRLLFLQKRTWEVEENKQPAQVRFTE